MVESRAPADKNRASYVSVTVSFRDPARFIRDLARSRITHPIEAP